MHKRSSAFWCCTLLLVASSLELRQNSTNNVKQNDNSTVQYEVYLNSTRNREDKVELEHNLRENSTDNNDVQYQFHTNSTNHRKDDSTRYEFRTHSTDHEKSNHMLMELRRNSTKIDDENNSVPIYYGNFTRTENKNLTSELLGNLTQIESKSDLTSYEVHEKSSKNGTENNFPHEMCDSNTCIQLCCPLGDRLVKEKCVPGGGNYPFPDVYSYTTSDLLQNENKKVNELFQLVVHDPCRETERFLLNPVEYPDDEYMFLVNGSLYQPQHEEFLQPTSYCLAVVRDKFEVTVCFESINDETIAETNQLTSKPVGLIISLPFLLTTFVVYSVLPELKNMHGYTLRGYVGSLFIAYTVLAVLQLTHPNSIEYSVCITLGTAYPNYIIA